MNFEETQALNTNTNKERPVDRELELMADQLKEAVQEEDYEQAAFLRDEIRARQNSELPKDSEISETDPKPDKREMYLPSKDDPRVKAWDRLRERKQEDLWEGQEKVDSSELVEYFSADSREMRKFGDGLKDDLHKLEGKSGTERVDALLSLYNKKEATEEMLELAKEKFNSIWQPYRAKAGLTGAEYDEYKSFYQGYSFTGEQLKKLDEMPVVYQKPLAYWQKVYDNSRTMLDELNKAIEKIERSSERQ